MALIVEDGTGKADAESYISVADCDALLISWGRSTTEWTSLDEAGKEAQLRNSTMYIDSNYSHCFTGEVSNDSQALAWPRIDAYKKNGQYIPSNSIPPEVKKACSFVAVESITGGVYANEDNGSLIDSESVGLGSGALSESKSYLGGKSSEFTSKSSDLVLNPVLSNCGRDILRG